MLKEIELDSMFTPYTIDTYQTFTMDDEEERTMEDLSEQVGRELTYDDIDWNYNHKEFVQALANRRFEILKDNILDDVIIDIKQNGEAVSPKEYNFKTDDSFEIYTVDIVKLNQYVSNNIADYQKNKLQDGPGFWWFGDEDQTKLNYYLFTKTKKEYGSDEAYYYDMVEGIDFQDFIEAKVIETKHCENCTKEIEEGAEHCPNCLAEQDTCPKGGDSRNGCKDCVYAQDYHCVDGECVERK